MTYKWLKDNKPALFGIASLPFCLAIGWALWFPLRLQIKLADIFPPLFEFIIFIAILFSCLYITRNIISIRIRTWFLFTIVFIVAFPRFGRAITTGLDSSWQYAINYFFANNLRFGKDALFSYGPLGFLEAPQPLGVNLLLGTCYNFILHLLLVCSGVYLITSIHKKAKPLETAIYIALFVWVLINCNRVALTLTASISIAPLLVSMLILGHEESGWPIFMPVAAGYVAVIFLVKVGSGIICLAVLGSYLAVKSVKEKKYTLFLWVSGFIVATFLAIWLILYGGLGGIAGYAFSSFQFIKGVGSAMSLDPGNDSSAAFFLATLAAMIYFMFYLKEKNVYLITSILLLPSLLMFKYAFGRQDGYHTIVFFNYLLAYFFLVVIQRLSVRKKAVFSAVFCIPLLISYAIAMEQPPAVRSSVFKSGANNLYDSSFGYAPQKARLEAISRFFLQGQLLSKEMSEEIKTFPTDIYPCDVTYSLANNLNWHPRPVFQSYIAYTPWLDEANSEFFKGEGAPLYIVWVTDRPGGQAGSIDGRFVFNDEPKTMRMILNNYEPILYDQKAVLMRKKERPTFGRSVELFVKRYGWGEWIDVPRPRSACINAKIAFAPNLYGKIKRLLWKEKEVFIEYKLKNNDIKKHRLVIDNAISGVWMQPYITDTASALKNASAGHGIDTDDKDNLFFGKTVEQIRLSYKDKNTFDPHFTITWEKTDLNR